MSHILNLKAWSPTSIIFVIKAALKQILIVMKSPTGDKDYFLWQFIKITTALYLKSWPKIVDVVVIILMMWTSVTTITWNPLEHITTLLSLQCHCVAMGHISSQNVCCSFDKGISKLPKPSDQLAGLRMSTKIAWTIIMDDRNIFSHSYDVTVTRDFIHALLPLSKLVIFWSQSLPCLFFLTIYFVSKYVEYIFTHSKKHINR